VSNDRPIELSSLRDIGWREWDPIGLRAAGEEWNDKPFADEYDTYLLKAASDLRHGASRQHMIGFFIDIERKFIGPDICTEKMSAPGRRPVQSRTI
jgi:hypothetical protein